MKSTVSTLLNVLKCQFGTGLNHRYRGIFRLFMLTVPLFYKIKINLTSVVSGRKRTDDVNVFKAIQRSSLRGQVPQIVEKSYNRCLLYEVNVSGPTSDFP